MTTLPWGGTPATRITITFHYFKAHLIRQGHLVVGGQAEQGEGGVRLGRVIAAGGGDGGRAGAAEEADGRVAQGGHDLGDGTGAHLRAILVEGDIADPMGAVLDAPVGAQDAQECGGRG